MRRWALLALFAAILLMGGTPERALDFLTTPDGEEYAVSAFGLATHGRYEIVIDGRAHPPRYPPGFPLLAALVGTLRGHPELHDGALVTWLAGIACVVFAFLLGRRLDRGTATFAPWLVGTSMTLAWYARTILAEAPLAALHLAVAWLFVAWIHEGQRTRWRPLLAGLLVGCAAAMRQTAFFLLVPFALAWLLRSGAPPEGRRPRLGPGLLALGPLAALALQALDGRWRFGAAFRSGYQYWCSNPYDRLDLTFSTRFLFEEGHLPALLRALHLQLADVAAFGAHPASETLAIALFGLAFWSGLALLLRRSRTRPLALFALVLLASDLLFFGLYFYYEDRFLLALLPLHLVIAAHAATHAFLRLRPRLPRLALAALLLAAAGGPLVQKTRFFEDHLLRRFRPDSELATMLGATDETLEPDAVVVSDLSAPLIAHFLQRGHSDRRYVPLFESTEYRNKVVAPEPPPHPELLPEGQPTLHRYPRAAENGAVPPLPFSAESDPDAVVALLAAGRPVWVLATTAATTRLGGTLPARLEPVLTTRNLRLLRIR